MSRILSCGLIGVALAMVIAWEAAPVAGMSPDQAPAGHASADPVHTANGSVLEVSETPWVAIALERPLFQENRRPAKAAGGAVDTDRTARLTGVMTGPFGSRAIFASPGDSKSIVVAEGARLSDFVVRAIGPGMAVVETETGIRTLRLSLKAATVSPPRQ